MPEHDVKKLIIHDLKDSDKLKKLIIHDFKRQSILSSYIEIFAS